MSSSSPDNLQPLSYETPEANAPARSPLKELFFLAGPTVAQMASYTVMHFIDTLMLSRVGDASAAAAGTAGMFSFTLISFGFGVLLLVNTLVSQSYGKKDYPDCGRYMWQGLWWSFAYALLILPLIPLMPRLFGLLGHEAKLVDLEIIYFRIVVAASILKLAATAVGDFLLAINRPRAVLVAAVTGVLFNTAAGWYMMLAPNGPHMGVAGAAYAQCVGMLIEFLILLAFVLQPAIRQRFNVLDWKPRWHQMKMLMKLGTPSGLQTVTDVLAWSLFLSAVIGTFGTNAIAANSYMFRFMMVSFMPCFGLSAAVTALVGRYIGMGRPDLAEHRAHLGFKVASIYMLACGLVYFFGRYPLIKLFTTDPHVAQLGAVLLIFAALYQLFDAMFIIYSGALRGAGDTLIPSLVTGTLCWGIMLFGGWIVARYRPDWGVVGPWTVATLYGGILGAFMLTRFKRGRWKLIRLEQDNAFDKVPGFPVVPQPEA